MNGMVNPEDYVGIELWDNWEGAPVETEQDDVDLGTLVVPEGDTELHMSIAGDRYRSPRWALGLVGGILIAGAIGFLLTNAGTTAIQMIAGW